MNEDQTVGAPVAKTIAAWGAAGGAAAVEGASKIGLTINSWSDVAAMLAAVYTATLIFEWWWKKFWRPMLEDRGILKRKIKTRRRAIDADTESAPL